jgi:peroxin-6
MKMALLFDQHQSAESSFTVKLAPEQGGLDTILVGKGLWKLLDISAASQLFLSLSPRQTQENGEHPLRTISCWAVPDEGVCTSSTYRAHHHKVIIYFT